MDNRGTTVILIYEKIFEEKNIVQLQINTDICIYFLVTGFSLGEEGIWTGYSVNTKLK